MWRVVLVGVLIAGAAALGRATAPANEGDAGVRNEGAAGVRNEREAGVREGRALQVPPAARDAFQAGYEAGANDVFGGYDGGWDLDRGYVITLKPGENGVTYRIATRRPAG